VRREEKYIRAKENRPWRREERLVENQSWHSHEAVIDKIKRRAMIKTENRTISFGRKSKACWKKRDPSVLSLARKL